MKVGHIEIVRRIHCPYCLHSEFMDHLEKYEDFKFKECEDSGSAHIWECLKCEKQFKIYLE